MSRWQLILYGALFVLFVVVLTAALSHQVGLPVTFGFPLSFAAITGLFAVALYARMAFGLLLFVPLFFEGLGLSVVAVVAGEAAS